MILSSLAHTSYFQLVVDKIQIDFQCCGNTGPENWYTVQWKKDEYLRSPDLRRYIVQSPLHRLTELVLIEYGELVYTTLPTHHSAAVIQNLPSLRVNTKILTTLPFTGTSMTH